MSAPPLSSPLVSCRIVSRASSLTRSRTRACSPFSHNLAASVPLYPSPPQCPRPGLRRPSTTPCSVLSVQPQRRSRSSYPPLLPSRHTRTCCPAWTTCSLHRHARLPPLHSSATLFLSRRQSPPLLSLDMSRQATPLPCLTLLRRLLLLLMAMWRRPLPHIRDRQSRLLSTHRKLSL